MPDARAILDDSRLRCRLTRLGLRDDDAEALGEVVARLLRRPADLAAVDRLGLGLFPGEQDLDRWAGYDPDGDPYGTGVLPLLALVVTADDLEQFHRSRGV